MVFDLGHGRIHRARVEAVYPSIADGTVTLVHSDGPYNLGKAAWDKVGDLAAFYRPHIAAWSRVCAPSASVYLWGTAEGWAAVHPEMVAGGWTFRRLLVWDKLNTAASMTWEKSDRWPDTSEVCGFYARGNPWFAASWPRSVWPMAIQGWADERLTTGEFRSGARNQNGVPCIVAEAAHPTQKPLAFAERIIRASSRPGDLVLDPFGGTCRIAVANERIARHDPAEARRTLTVEQDEDGRDYIGAVLRSMGDDLGTPAHAVGQLRLFAGGAHAATSAR